MPNWGLTTATRRTRPYGLNDWWLGPSKVVTDPIQGDVFLTRLEQLFLDTPPLQRLRRVRQLGSTHLVYPGATHSRLSHSLGAVKVVQTLLDHAIDQRNRNHPVPDLFAEWEDQARRDASIGDFHTAELEEIASDIDDEFWRVLYRRRLGEATVLARLGALLHDVGHLPFGHTIEDDLGLLPPHDSGVQRLSLIWSEFEASWQHRLKEMAQRDPMLDADKQSENLASLRTSGQLKEELTWLILSNQRSPDGEKLSAVTHLSYPFVADMVGNTICADLLDYLDRDHIFAGLPISLGKRYLSSFYITPSQAGGLYPERMALLIARDGRERSDISTEILKHLRYRYELQERVLVHHTKLAADAMVGKLFELWLEATETALQTNAEQLAEVMEQVPADFRVSEEDGGSASEIVRAARFSLERLLLKHGDDGVLEAIAASIELSAPASDLAEALLSRDLFKPAAIAVDAAAADDLYSRFGSHQERRDLERAACTYAAISDPWHVVVWVPDPRMRLKLAELLVDDGKGVAKFKDKSSRGQDIYEAHRKLWTISVFVHPSVTPRQRVAALARLGQLLGVSWDTYRSELGGDPSLGPQHLAAVRVLGLPGGESKVVELIQEAKSDGLAARSDISTQTGLDREMHALAKRRGILTLVED